MFYYFIHYEANFKGQLALKGNVECVRSYPITHMDDIRQIEDDLIQDVRKNPSNNKIDRLMVVNYQLLRKE